MKLNNILLGMLMPFATMLVSCSQEDPEPENITVVVQLTEIETSGELVSDDYQGARSTYYYDWNGSYFSEDHISIKSDGTLIYTSVNLKGEVYYLEEGSSTALLLDPSIPTNTDLAVIDEVVYLVAFSSVFEEDRKLYVYQKVGEGFEVLDSASIDYGTASVRLFASEGIDGELLIHVNPPYGMDHVYRFKNGRLQPFMTYENPDSKHVVFPFKGNYLEYTGSRLNRLDDQGNATTLLDQEDLELPDGLGWHYLYFSGELILIDLKELVNTERAFALAYDGQELMKIEMPLFYSSGGHPIHTPFNQGHKYLHYNPASRLLDVYFAGVSSIQFNTYNRVYQYQIALEN